MRLLSKQLCILVLVASVILTSVGCNNKDTTPRQIKTGLQKAAATLNTAAKENRLLYQQKVFGDRALEIRRKVATAIHGANEGVIVALDVAKGMTPATFTGDKAQILTLLSQAITELSNARIGDNRIDLVLQGIAATINSVIVFVTALTHASLPHTILDKYVMLHEVNKQLTQFGAVREYALVDMGGY